MSKKILTVDDDADFIEAITALLTANGYEVVSAPNGSEGFAKAKAESPDLIMLDVMMTQETEGFDISRSLQGEPSTKNIPVIIVTGIKKEMDLKYDFKPDASWLPVKAVLEKPVQPEVLLRTIKEHIA